MDREIMVDSREGFDCEADWADFQAWLDDEWERANDELRHWADNLQEEELVSPV